MPAHLSDQSTLGEAMQMYCLAVLEKVKKSFAGAEVEVNGAASAKMLIPADIGFDYIYVGIEPNGDLAVLQHFAMASGRPSVLFGPIKPGRAVNFTVTSLANKIVTLLKD